MLGSWDDGTVALAWSCNDGMFVPLSDDGTLVPGLEVMAPLCRPIKLAVVIAVPSLTKTESEKSLQMLFYSLNLLSANG